MSLKIVTLFANQAHGTYEHIYATRDECLVNHPGADVLTGFGVMDGSTGFLDIDSEDFYPTEAAARVYIDRISSRGSRNPDMGDAEFALCECSAHYRESGTRHTPGCPADTGE